MQSFIESLYHGSLEPQELNPSLAPKVREKHKKLTDKEEQIRKMMSGRGLRIFEEYIELYSDYSCTSCTDSFISGFKHGAKLIYDTFVDK